MKRVNFSIRTLLLIIISVLNILIAAPLGYMMYTSIIDYQNVQNIKQISQAVTYFYDAKKYLSTERAASQAILFVPSSEASLKEEIENSRKHADKAYEEAINVLEQYEKDKNNIDFYIALAQVQEDYDHLKALRHQLDSALTKPFAKRDLTLPDQFFTQITQLADSLTHLIDNYSQGAFIYDSSIARQMRFTRFIWEISEYTGRQYAVLGKMIAQNKYPTPQMQKNIILWRNRIEYGLEIAQGASASLRWKDEILPYMEEAATHYFMTFEQIEGLFDNTGQKSETLFYPISVEIWLEMAAQVSDSLSNLTDTIMAVNQKYMEEIERDAEMSIVIMLMLLLSALALSLYTWLLITKRVIRPVNSMVEVLYKETKISNQIIPEQNSADEISKLGMVLKVFQENSRQLQEERDKAQTANIAKSEFLANMSHEIRTPMNVIVGITSILANSSPTKEKREKFIKTLQVSADSMLSLVNDLLDFSKLETQTVELEKIPFNLASIAEEVVTLIALNTKEKGLAFYKNFSDVKNKQFSGDPTRVRQILLNICSNAVKFTEKGSITFNIGTSPHKKPHYENINIMVRDTGIGIAPEKIDFLFEKFTQADSSVSRKYGGTGLGLAIVKNLVQMMDGTIKVESEENEGTSFYITLPLLKSKDIPQSKKKPALKSKSGPSKKQVLLVEDYQPNIMVAGTFLEEIGYKYDVAQNGHEAIQKFMEKVYDIVLMDIQMPGMNGYEATQAIREFEKKERQKPSKIIGVTAHASFDDRAKCLRAGMNDYLAKPFKAQDLKKTLML